jgi:DDE superfamily endonuclease
MKLWNIWLSVVNQLEGAFSRKKTFFWFVLVLIGFTIKFDAMGVTSLARGVGLLPSYYTSMLHFFTSSAVDLEALQRLWVSVVFKCFTGIVRINGRCVIAGDGIKIGKEGKKMPAVKWLHQSSGSNSKAEYITGHSIQVVALLIHGLSTYFAVPLAGQIHEGLRLNSDDSRTQLDKLFEMVVGLSLPETFYLVLDKYYCSGSLMKQLTSKNIHIVTMMKSSAVAYKPAIKSETKKRGRPLKYGAKIKLFRLFDQEQVWLKTTLESGIVIEYCCVELFWRPFGDLVLFVLTKHPTKGKAIVMSTDRTVPPLSLIVLYGLRFKIEVLFKQAVHQIGAFLYRFWIKSIKPRERKQRGDQNLDDFNGTLQARIKQKMHAYHVFILCGLVAQGLLHYLSIHYYKSVWSNFGSWLRTIRPNTLPSEMVTALALSQTYDYFLEEEQDMSNFKKFLLKKIASREVRHQISSASEAA